MALDSNETSCEMEDAISSQDRQRLQPFVDAAMASAKQVVKACVDRFTCEFRALVKVLPQDDSEDESLERLKVLRDADEEELAKVYEKLFVMQERIDKEVGRSRVGLREKERSLRLRTDSLVYKIKVQQQMAKIIELCPDKDEQVKEAADSQVVESLRLQVERLEREKEEMAKEVDSLRLQLKGGKKVIENFPPFVATGMEVDPGEVVGAKENAMPTQSNSTRERLQKEIEVAPVEQEKAVEEEGRAELRASKKAHTESLVDHSIVMREVDDHQAVVRSHGRDRSLKRKADSMELQLKEQTEAAESLRLKVARLEQEKEEMKASESLRFQVVKLELEVEHIKVVESLRLQVARLEQQKEEMKVGESLRLQVARLEQEKAEMKAGETLRLQLAKLVHVVEQMKAANPPCG